MKRLYLNPGGVLSTTPGTSTPGSIFVGEFEEFVYPFSSQEVLARGAIKVEILTNASGDIQINPVLLVRDLSGAAVVENRVWAGTRKSAGVGTVLTWEGEQPFQGDLRQRNVVLRFETMGTEGASATFGLGDDVYVDLDIRAGTRVEQDIFTRGDFYLFKRRESKVIWTRGDVKHHVETDVYTKGSYSAQHTQDFYTRGDVKHHTQLTFYTEGVVHPLPGAGSPSIENLRIGDNALSLNSEVVDARSIQERLDQLDPLPTVPTPPILDSVPQSREPLTKVAEALLSASEFVRSEPIPVVPGNLLEVYFPHDSEESDLVLKNGEWQLPSVYNPQVTYELPLVSHTIQTTLRMIVVGIRYIPSDVLLTAEMNGTPGRLILNKDISPLEEFAAWVWVDPQPNPDPPYYYPVVGVTNPTGLDPGFRGTGAALLVS